MDIYGSCWVGEVELSDPCLDAVNSVIYACCNIEVCAGDRITTVGYGAAKPVSSNKTEEGRRLNRRIEITISRM